MTVVRARMNVLARPTAFVAAALLLAAASACASTTVAVAASPRPDPHALVLRISVDGGFIAPGVILTRVPTVSVYADGRVITTGAIAQVFPGPALAPLVVARLTPAGLARVVSAARRAGLAGPDATYPFPGVADMPTTVFTFVSGGRVHTVSAYALGATTPVPGLPASTVAARAKLAAFAARMSDLRGWLGPRGIGAERTYVPTAVRAYPQPATVQVPTDGSPAPTIVDWPLPAPLATFGKPYGTYEPPMRCGALRGKDLVTAMPAFRTATSLTYWRSDGATYAVTLRPLLPDEPDCPVR